MSGESRRVRWAATLALVSVAAGVAAVFGLAAPTDAAEPAEAAFRLEDGSVGCRLVSPDQLACRAAGAETAAVLDAEGGSRPDDVTVDLGTAVPVLLPSESWWNGAFSCRVRDGAVTCASGDGAVTVSPGGLGGVR